jgi:hypothetical protein
MQVAVQELHAAFLLVLMVSIKVSVKLLVLHMVHLLCWIHLEVAQQALNAVFLFVLIVSVMVTVNLLVLHMVRLQLQTYPEIANHLRLYAALEKQL